MKISLCLPLLAVLAAAAPAAAQTGEASGHICIRDHDIRTSKITSDRTIEFRLNNGKTYINTLRQTCPGLRMADGFAYDGTPNGELCDNQGIITVLRVGSHCMLGAFTLAPAPAAGDAPQAQ